MELYTERYSKKVGKSSGYAGFRNRRRLSLLTKLIPVKESDIVLEVGPNTCLLLDKIKESAKSVVGIDINEEAVLKLNRSDLLHMDAANMSFDDNTFNIVVGIEVFEHIPDLQKIFSEIARVLKRNGKCYMTVPFEIFRGQQALGDAWFTYRNLTMARKLHVHKLNPKKVRQMIADTYLEMVSSKLIWIPGPSYFIVLEKQTSGS